MSESNFEWDSNKERINIATHGVSFFEAQFAFKDPKRVIAKDTKHSDQENRYFCFGLNQEKTGILTVRFTYRDSKIRLIGAGYWRKGKKVYETSNKI